MLPVQEIDSDVRSNDKQRQLLEKYECFINK